MWFYSSWKICIFPTGLTRDSGQKFQISFEPTYPQKRPWFCRLMMFLFSKRGFLDDKMSFYYRRKISIFLRGLNHDSGQKLHRSFEPIFFVNRHLGFVVWWCFLGKGGFVHDKNAIFLYMKNLHFSKGLNPWFWSKIPNIFLSLLFCKTDLGFVFWWCGFLKRRLFL